MSKFQIPTPPRSTSKSIRFPTDILNGIEQAICGQNMTLTYFVISACKKALADLEVDYE
jgi:hypothetical protein